MKIVERSTLKQAVTRGAAFGSAALTLALAALPVSAAERALAGVRIFSTTRAVLQKYKNPSEVIVGRPSLFPTTGLAGGSGMGMSGTPGAGGFPGPGGMSGMSGPGGMSSAPGALPGFGGGAPSEFGGGAPGGFGAPGGYGGAPGGYGGGGQGRFGAPGGFGGAPGMGGTLGANGALAGSDPNGSNPGEVTWIYDRPNGNDIEFTMASDGRVIQVRATGYKNGAIRTAKGVTLGQTYAQVVTKYGYPESQEQMGTVLTARYTDRDHVAFQFYNQRLVAIIVAAVE